MKAKKTILIYGISSFLGSNLAEKLKEKYRVVGTYYNNQVSIDGVLSIKCDVHNKEMVQKVALMFQPDISIYAIGLSNLTLCDNFPKVADALNTAGVFNVSTAAERYNSKFIYFSSAYVFAGENTVYRENDTPMPLTTYGNTVASSEFYIQKSCLNYIIFRCGQFIGRSYNPHDLTWSESIEKCNYHGMNITCDNKVHTGYIDLDTVVSVLDRALNMNITNRVFQLTSQDTMTRYEFALKYLEVFQGNQSLVSKKDWVFPKSQSLKSLQELGEELCFHLDINNIESALNIKMPTVEAALKRYRKSVKGALTGVQVKSTGVTFI